MILGFTGTRKGMTPAQATAVSVAIPKLYAVLREFHHGCCVGADKEAYDLVRQLAGCEIVAHPPDKDKYFAFETLHGSHRVLPVKDPLARNRDIVAACDRLWAAPDSTDAGPRSGTWYTIRQARKAKKELVVFWPDGTVTEEHP